MGNLAGSIIYIIVVCVCASVTLMCGALVLGGGNGIKLPYQLWTRKGVSDEPDFTWLEIYLCAFFRTKESSQFLPSHHLCPSINYKCYTKEEKKNNTAIFCQVGDCVEIGIPMLILLIGLSQVLCLLKISYTKKFYKIQQTLVWPIFFMSNLK